MSAQHRGYLSIYLGGPAGLFQSQPMLGWITYGTVTTAHGEGALVRHRVTGMYCQANEGALRSLPQRKVLAALAAAEPARQIDGTVDEYLT